MLPEIIEKLRCPVCRVDATLQLIPFANGEAGHVREGVLACSKCAAWHRIENECSSSSHRRWPIIWPGNGSTSDMPQL